MSNAKVKKHITMPQVRAIYEGGLRGYENSYAMMVDDALDGMDEAGKKAGLWILCDVQWFGVMFSNIKSGRPWEYLSEKTREDLKAMMNDQLTYVQGKCKL